MQKWVMRLKELLNLQEGTLQILIKLQWNDCDEYFQKYLSALNEGNNVVISELYDDYQEKRNKLNADLFVKSDRKYKDIIECRDSKRLWGLINWSDDMPSSPNNHPPIEELSEHFRNLYEPITDDGDINSLSCDTYNPETDHPITETELKETCNQMKKGGYDFSINCLLLLLSTIGGVLLLLMNKILFGSFPSRLCTWSWSPNGLNITAYRST